MLTKSLHTITAVTKVAAHLAREGNRADALDLTAAALAILGYPMARSALHLAAMSDPTLNKCIESVAKVTGRSQSALAADSTVAIKRKALQRTQARAASTVFCGEPTCPGAHAVGGERCEVQS